MTIYLDPEPFIGGTAVMHLHPRPVEREELRAAEEDMASMARLVIALLDQRPRQFITDAERTRLMDRMHALTAAQAAAYPEVGDV